MDCVRNVVRDRRLISIKEPLEVIAWCKRLHCTEADLRWAVSRAGHCVGRVQEALEKGKRTRAPTQSLLALRLRQGGPAYGR
jgi:hypothetical protein